MVNLSMRHDWIFDVLTDLRSYALKNNLRDLAAKVEETMRAARIEMRRMERDAEAEDDDGDDDIPPIGRPN